LDTLLTGAAGFIGYHVALALLTRGQTVLGVDNLNDYYDTRLKQARLQRLSVHDGFRFVRADVADRAAMRSVLTNHSEITNVVHLAAQAGVRHSLVDPYAYIQSNVMGHLVMLEEARRLSGLQHLVYASSSSVYGANQTLPFRETDRVDQPTSLYGATKRADELMSHAYGHLFDLPQTGLRFFTVYGPWGRPDMAYYDFARAIVARKPIVLYEDGAVVRDFTYIDDIVEGTLGCFDKPPEGKPPVRVVNIGNHRSEPVSTLVTLLEQALGLPAIVRYAPRPMADVAQTFACVDHISTLTGFRPATSLAEGLPRFVDWFKYWTGLDTVGRSAKAVH
jgi:UDP-glucuronate 4-epimerase